MIYAVNKRTKEHLICGMSIKRSDSQWHFVEADEDGWIEWRGGECPFPKDQPYEVGFIKDGHTISYRPILVPDDTLQAPEWDGEGLPPVGTVCECKPTSGWVKCKVVAHRDGYAIAWVDLGNRPCAPVLKARHFRPIRTDREKWINQAAEMALQSGDALGNIYDALKSGELPQP